MLSEEMLKRIATEIEGIEDFDRKEKVRKKAIDKALSELPNPRQEVLHSLEIQVREYIQWAKSQGVY